MEALSGTRVDISGASMQHHYLSLVSTLPAPNEPPGETLTTVILSTLT